ncbi:tetratricopeptide repeat protein [Streptomyces sp. NPDC047000]|uniref:ATP-binding protein n=1 Tax=Streptomyces sp. NPDC047000 TaxID=3155474 RepID=UPI0033C21B63
MGVEVEKDISMAEVIPVENEFSGGRAENVVQAGVVHGGIHLVPADHSFPPPRQLPLRPSRFVNRRSSMAVLSTMLTSPSSETESREARIATVIGPPGIGKTAFALHWSYIRRDNFPDGDLYVDMQGYGAGEVVNAFQALDSFLRSLNIPADRIPETLEERSSLFRSLLSGRTMLLVIDNVSTSAQVRPLLPAAQNCFTVVTSRSALPGLVARDGASRLTLDVLNPQESVDLLAQFVDPVAVQREKPAAARLAELCGYLPIALRVVGERAARRTHVSLRDLVDELEGELERLDALQSAEDELSDTRAVFSWSYRALDVTQQGAFRKLGLHAGAEFGVGAAASLLGVSVREAKKLLLSLSSVSLIQEVHANRFKLHDLLHSYAVELSSAEDSLKDRTDAVRRMLTWYLLTADRCRQVVLPHSAEVPLVPARGIDEPDDFGGRAEAWDWFECERLNLLTALETANELAQLDIVWKLALVISGPLELRSYWADWESSVRAGLLAARTLGDELGEAASLLVLGDASWRIGRLDDAFAQYESAALIGNSLKIPWIEGFARRGMGLLRAEGGDAETALTYFTEALNIFQEVDHRRGAGMSLLSLAKSHQALNDEAAAMECGARALRVFETIEDPWTLAWGRLTQASILTAASLDDQALELLRQALATFRESGDRRSEAMALTEMAEISYRHSNTAAASTHWLEAAEALEAIGDPQSDELRQRVAEMSGD